MDKWKRFWESNQSGWERTKWTPTYTFITGYQPTGKAPDELHPPSGGSNVFDPLINNSESLSAKQLHELITSQSMTIDRLLGEINKRDEEIKAQKEMIQKYVNMCEDYKKMTEEYQKMFEFFQHPGVKLA